VDETSHQCQKQDDKLFMVDGDGKLCVRCVVFVFVFVFLLVGYGLVSFYDQWHLSFFLCLLWMCYVWSKVVVKIFCLDVNENEMVVEFKKEGC